MSTGPSPVHNRWRAGGNGEWPVACQRSCAWLRDGSCRRHVPRCAVRITAINSETGFVRDDIADWWTHLCIGIATLCRGGEPCSGFHLYDRSALLRSLPGGNQRHQGLKTMRRSLKARCHFLYYSCIILLENSPGSRQHGAHRLLRSARHRRRHKHHETG
jgi:hypothetical protein